MHYLKPVISEINAKIVARIPGRIESQANPVLAHNIVFPVVVKNELQHYTSDWVQASLWDNDSDVVFYHKIFREGYTSSIGYGERTLYKSESFITIYICSEYEDTHGTILDVLSKIEYIQLSESNFNKPEIIQSETLRLEKMNIEQFVSSITYYINKDLYELLKMC